MPPQKSIAIVGGGISGLAAASQIQNRMPDSRVVVFESSDRLGGILRTESIDGYLVEHSADMFTTQTPVALELIQDLGKSDQLLSTQPVSQRAFIATSIENAGRQFLPVPHGFSLMLPNDIQAVLDSELLDQNGKQRFIEEENIPPGDDRDESLADFARRRFGEQAFNHLIQPLVSGIYTADPEKLSMQATMGRFLKLEREHGSLIAAAKANQKHTATEVNTFDRLGFADQTASGARYDLFRAPREGMGQLVDWLIDSLCDVEVRTKTQVNSIKQMASGWNLDTDSSTVATGKSSESFDGIILATPAKTAGRLMDQVDAQLSRELCSIETAGCAIVVLGLEQQQLANPFHGYGIVVPASLNRKLIAVSCSSNKFAGRAPDGKILIRCFLGGAMQPELVELPDEHLLELCLQELNHIFAIDGQPELAKIFHWRNAMPQYHVGHLDRVSSINERIVKIPGLELAGNSYHGVGVPACIESGQSAVIRLAESFANK